MIKKEFLCFKNLENMNSIMSFQQLYEKVTSNGEKEALNNAIKNRILEASETGFRTTKFFNPYEYNNKWDNDVIEELEEAGFTVETNIYCVETTYKISW